MGEVPVEINKSIEIQANMLPKSFCVWEYDTTLNVR